MQKTVMLLAALAVSLGGCAMREMAYLGMEMGGPSDARTAAALPEVAAADTTPPIEAVDTPRLAVIAPRKIIYAGTFTVVTGDVIYALDRTRALADEMDGYLQKMSSNAMSETWLCSTPFLARSSSMVSSEKPCIVSDRSLCSWRRQTVPAGNIGCW